VGSIELSICIPTRNFGAYIRQTLDSIIKQQDERLEVVILDGGSTDETQAVVEARATRHTFIRYYRQPEAGGIDRDLATLVSMARGRYCWLMSADDVPMPGAVSRILEEIRSGCDVYLFNRIECDVELLPVTVKSWLEAGVRDLQVDFKDMEQVTRYFSQARSLGAIFSYISSITVSRDRWNRVGIDFNFAGTNYMHVNTILQMLKGEGTLRYIRDPLVWCRGGNDSFLESGDKGIVRRYLIDLDGYLRILSHQNYPPPIRQAAFGVMRWEHAWIMWVRVAIRVDDSEKWRCISNKLRRFGYASAGLFLIGLLRRIECVVPIIRTLRRIRTLPH